MQQDKEGGSCSSLRETVVVRIDKGSILEIFRKQNQEDLIIRSKGGWSWGSWGEKKVINES